MLKLIAAIALLATPLAPAFARDRDGDYGRPTHHEHHGVYGAPGPIAGAGLPVLILGGGLWLCRRLRRRA